MSSKLTFIIFHEISASFCSPKCLKGVVAKAALTRQSKRRNKTNSTQVRSAIQKIESYDGVGIFSFLE